jgi:TrmH family RNA methyltransferase
MISLTKLVTLPRKTRLRKIITLLQQMEMELAAGSAVNGEYLRGLVSLLADERGFAPWLQKRVIEAAAFLKSPEDSKDRELLRLLGDLRFGLQQFFGIEPADWDLLDFSTGRLQHEGRRVLPLRVFCEDLRSPYNVGSIFRTAESFGVERIYLSPSTPTPEHPRVRRTAMGCTDLIPWERREIESCSGEEGVFVLETGGTSVKTFQFPQRGLVIVGSEELGASPEALRCAERGCGRVSIETCGVKGSLNAAVAFGILMHAWHRAIS